MAERGAVAKNSIGLLPWVAVTVFAVVGAGIVFELVRSLLDGRGFAVMLELVFALVWLFVAVAYWQDVKKRSTTGPRRGPRRVPR